MENKRILVIDDEFDIREFLTYNLRKEGYIVQSFGNPVEALWEIWGNPPDLLLTDWLMPELDGIDVCMAVKTDFKTAHIPIIMITCKGEESDMLMALNNGADDYLKKPFLMKDLLVRVQKHLDKKYDSTQIC
jgi:two-component system, OmpR family, phosphate regulon response regulator PhoB